MVAIFADQNLRQQTRRGQAAIQQPFRQGGDHRHRVHFRPVDILLADEAAAQKAGGFVIKLFADFLPNAPPLFGLGFHRFGFDHFFHHGQMFWQPGSGFLPGARSRHFGHRHHRSHRGGGRTGQLQQQFQLGPVHRFAAGAKYAAHQRINLLAQQRVLLPGQCQGLLQRADELAQGGQFSR